MRRIALAKQIGNEGLNLAGSDASWHHGNLKAGFREPFDMLAKNGTFAPGK